MASWLIYCWANFNQLPGSGKKFVPSVSHQRVATTNHMPHHFQAQTAARRVASSHVNVAAQAVGHTHFGVSENDTRAGSSLLKGYPRVFLYTLYTCVNVCNQQKEKHQQPIWSVCLSDRPSVHSRIDKLVTV